MRILIVGAGIAGLAAAALLQEEHDVTIIEKDKQQEHKGYLIGLWESTKPALKKIGVYEEIRKTSIQNPDFGFYTPQGEEFLRVSLGSKPMNRILGHNHLRELLEETLNKPVQYNKHLQQITETTNTIHARIDNQQQEYDLIIGADGTHSWIREHYFTAQKKEFPWTCHWARIDKVTIDTQAAEILAPGAVLGIYGSTNNQSCAILTLPNKKSISTAREQLRGIGADILQRMQDIHATQLYEIRCPQPHTKRMILIGDSAHAMPPFGGVGGTMAIEDAWVLAQELTTDLKETFENYLQRRQPRIRLARRQTHQQHQWKNIRNPLLARLRITIARHIPTEYFLRGYKKLVREEP